MTEKLMYVTTSGRTFEKREDALAAEKIETACKLVKDMDSIGELFSEEKILAVLRYIRDNKINTKAKLQEEIDYFAEVVKDYEENGKDE